MKVSGLKDFDQHISPLSLTFHWTRVFSFLTFSPAPYLNLTFSISLSSLSLSFLSASTQKQSYTYRKSKNIFMGFLNVLHLEIFPRIKLSVLFSDWLVPDRPVYKVSSQPFCIPQYGKVSSACKRMWGSMSDCCKSFSIHVCLSKIEQKWGMCI